MSEQDGNELTPQSRAPDSGHVQVQGPRIQAQARRAMRPTRARPRLSRSVSEAAAQEAAGSSVRQRRITGLYAIIDPVSLYN